MRTSGDASDISKALANTHSLSANRLNELDAAKGRKVWFQFWDTKLSWEASYLARLKYGHENPVHHRLVPVASQYPWCSAGWFEARADRRFQRKLESFRIDRVNISDPYEPVIDESIDKG